MIGSIKSWVLQICFWGLSYFLLLSLFRGEYSTGQADHVYTFLFHLPLLLIVYLNYLAFQRLFKTDRIGLYAFAFCFLAVLGVTSHFLIFELLAEFLFPGFYFISYYSVAAITATTCGYLVLSLLLFLSYNWFRLREKETELQKENSQIRIESLKAQVNPHFLFNSLNNIYSLTTENPRKSGKYMLQLSDSLRYMIYDTDSDYVTVEKELEYLTNYFELEKLRLEEDSDVTFKKIGDFSGRAIAPLIFVPLIENAFKFVDRSQPMISIRISMEGSQIRYLAENNIGENPGVKKGGKGMKNVRDRLALIYPNKHTLSVDESEQSYRIDLQINLDKQ